MQISQKIYMITRMNDSIYSFLLRDGKAVEIHRDPQQEDSLLGNIYVGKIKNIAKNIDAAFVEIAPGTICYLALRDAQNPVYTKKGSSAKIQAGDELLVQVSRESIKSKYPSVTANLTLHGKYVLLTTGNTSISVSSKLAKTEKARLADLMKQFSGSQSGDASAGYGWLVRTNAGGCEEQLLLEDAVRLRAEYGRLLAQAQYRTCFSCLLRTPAPYLARLQNLYSTEADRILTDDEALYEEIGEYLSRYQKEDVKKLELYRDRLLPMQKLYSLETQLSQALSQKVWLKSGGYLIIQPTEALTAIDVNTGKYEGGKNQEATFLKINKEAAAEIARQLRLRNLSGIIIVDFINMKQQASRDELMSLLDEQLKRDPVQTVLVDITKLSLVEITRKKIEKPLM